MRLRATNGQDKYAAPYYETCDARFPLSSSLDEATSHSTKLQNAAAKSLVIPQAGEEANEKGNLLSSPGILDFQDGYRYASFIFKVSRR